MTIPAVVRYANSANFDGKQAYDAGCNCAETREKEGSSSYYKTFFKNLRYYNGKYGSYRTMFLRSELFLNRHFDIRLFQRGTIWRESSLLSSVLTNPRKHLTTSRTTEKISTETFSENWVHNQGLKGFSHSFPFFLVIYLFNFPVSLSFP